MAESRAAISKDWLNIETTVTVPEGADEVILDAQPVAFAFMLDGSGSPGTDDWKSATWIGDAGTTRVARLMVGPGGTFVPTVAGYSIWRRITDDPEIPIEKVDWITFY